MTDFALPKRRYCEGSRKMVSWRFPEKLLKEIEGIAKQRGWATTDVVLTVLDRFVQATKEKDGKEG